MPNPKAAIFVCISIRTFLHKKLTTFGSGEQDVSFKGALVKHELYRKRQSNHTLIKVDIIR
jgi:hypothetical protein